MREGGRRRVSSKTLVGVGEWGEGREGGKTLDRGLKRAHVMGDGTGLESGGGKRKKASLRIRYDGSF